MTSIPSPSANISPKPDHSNFLQRLAFGIKGQELLIKSITTLILAVGAVLILTPFLFMISTSLKDQSQLRSDPLSILPRRPTTVEINGKQEPLYEVNLDGEVRQLALIKNLPGKKGQFVDPANPGQIYELPLADQKPIYHVEIHWENFHEALTSVPFDRYLINTLLVVFLSMAGMLFSCTLVAYGFSRFRAPGLNVLFLVLLSTIMLPEQVRLIPIYVMFQKLGWVDTLLPLIVPAFFANAYDVFLLRQYFMSIPKELDEAAMLDGAGPFRTLISIIIPQAVPAITAVTIFHFFFVWNQYFEPLVYLLGNEKLYPVSVGIGQFVTTFSTYPGRSAATAVLAMALPAVMFFLAQRQFMQGIVITGVEK